MANSWRRRGTTAPSGCGKLPAGRKSAAGRGPLIRNTAAILFLPGSLLGKAGPLGDRPGELLATGSRSGRIDLWNVKSRTPVQPIHGHVGIISVMVLSPDGRTLATASTDGSIKLWDIGTGRELRTLYRQATWMYAVAFSPDGNTLASGGLASGGASPLLRLWEAFLETRGMPVSRSRTGRQRRAVQVDQVGKSHHRYLG